MHVGIQRHLDGEIEIENEAESRVYTKTEADIWLYRRSFYSVVMIFELQQKAWAHERMDPRDSART